MSCRGCGGSRIVARGYCNACYLMERKHQMRQGTWEAKVQLVDASPAIEHLDRLNRAGVSRQQVVRLTGLHHTTVYRLHPGTKVHSRTVAQILAVEPPCGTPVAVPQDYLVSAVGTTRRLQALCAIGWPLHMQADRLGLASARSHVCEIARGEHDRVYARTARAMEKLYDALSMTVGPSQRVREDAVRRRWAPPLAWDDDDPQHHIDNPDAQPTGALIGRIEQVPWAQRYRELKALGYETDDEIAWRMGISRRSLNRMLTPSRHGNEVAS